MMNEEKKNNFNLSHAVTSGRVLVTTSPGKKSLLLLIMSICDCNVTTCHVRVQMLE